jgi:hypothetical protein
LFDNRYGEITADIIIIIIKFEMPPKNLQKNASSESYARHVWSSLGTPFDKMNVSTSHDKSEYTHTAHTAHTVLINMFANEPCTGPSSRNPSGGRRFR